MLKKIFSRLKKKSEESKISEIKEEIVDVSEELAIDKEDVSEIEVEKKETNITEIVDNSEKIIKRTITRSRSRSRSRDRI